MYPDGLLAAIGAWQNGWGDNQERRGELAAALRKEVAGLPRPMRSGAGATCYRKRFLHKGELVALILRDERVEELASWTTQYAFAERFKNKMRAGAVAGAIFRHRPEDSEVIVNIPALWSDLAFERAAEDYRARGMPNAAALFHFRANCQGEIVLDTPLRGSDIVALSGTSSPFDELCDQAGLPEEQRDIVFRQFVEQGRMPGLEPQFIGEEQSQRAIANTIARMLDLIDKAKP